jgi:2-polyprenyl-3-methyl-5-hydroxy-6-metoxy-1,4-benzoquinol methylase
VSLSQKMTANQRLRILNPQSRSPSANDFREPFRSQFIAAIQRGAASADIHDVSSRVAYAARSHRPSTGFLRRELGRPYDHAAHICRWIQHLASIHRILDVGCGTAGLSVALAWSFPDATVECFDADELAVQAANLRISGYAMLDRVRPRLLAPNSVFPFESGSFDLVTCASVLEFVTAIENRGRLLSEIRRVVRPLGHIVLTTTNPRYPFELHSGRFMGNWRHRPGYPWASTSGWIRGQLPNCVFSPVDGRVADKFGIQLPRSICRLIEPWLPWQFFLGQVQDLGDQDLDNIDRR